MGKHKMIKKLAFFLVVIMLLFVMVYSGLRIWESTVLYGEEEAAVTTVSKTITRDGVEYFPRQDINVMMVLGIDQAGPVESSQYYRNNGSADMIMLLIFDEKAETCSVVHLNRDTMLDMSVLGVRGEHAGTAYGQLALSHTYGTGLEDSCLNVKDTLEHFLPGLTIDHYVAMNMDAVTILNDALDGVTVHVQDDFSQVDPTIHQGEVTLHGDQALTFVQSRGKVGDQLNLSRMERQKEYMKHFMEELRDTLRSTDNFILQVYESIAPYIVSDMSMNTMDSMMERYQNYPVGETVSLAGENRLGEESYEFYVDEEALETLILELFYAPK